MKKRYIVVIGFAILLLCIVFMYRYLNTKSSYNSIYLVPENAVLILESEKPIDAWYAIVHSDAWLHLSKIPSIEELNNEILSIDSLVNSNKLLLRLFGNRKLTASVHQTNAGDIQVLYIIDIGKASRLQNIESLVEKILGEEYTITKRNYNEYPIYELHDRSSNEMYYFSLIEEKLVLSLRHTLVEASIDETSEMSIGRNLKFINVSKFIAGKGLFNMYIQYKYLSGYLGTLGIKSSAVQSLKGRTEFSGFYFDMTPEGLITVEGYSSLDDNVPSDYLELLYSDNTEVKSAGVIPQRVASMVKLNYKDAEEYFDHLLKSSTEQEYEVYRKDLTKTEKKLDISLRDNFFSWMDQEIVLLQTQPSNLGRTNEFMAILKAKNSRDLVKNLEYLEKQIKRNYPVKFKSVDYEGFEIHYLSVPGILKALFGKMLAKIEKPYYTIIEDHVIFSNHPRTIKNIIDDYKTENTLEKSVEYYNFTKELKNKTSVYCYFDLPVLYPNLKAFVDAERWGKLQANKSYITCFSNVGLQVDKYENLVHLLLKAQYKQEIEEFKMQHYTDWLTLNSFIDYDESEVTEQDTMVESEIIISDLDASKQTEYHTNGNEKFTVGLKNGLKHGTFKEYYSNGNVKIKGKFKDDKKHGTWKYYDFNGILVKEEEFDNGELISE